jgi:hypothetical protein
LYDRLQPALSLSNGCDRQTRSCLAPNRNYPKISQFGIPWITHPPYLNIIKYSDGKIEGDISNIGSVLKFCDEIQIIACELFRVLKPDRYCAILIGDTRKGRHYIPLSMYVLQRFLKAGFVLKEDIVKVQHNCAATGRWKVKALKDKFYLIMHEHLYVFRKPHEGEDLERIRYSCGQ